jgi:hypothetical protein
MSSTPIFMASQRLSTTRNPKAVSRRRRDILLCLRDALLNERKDETLKPARQLCGIEDQQMREHAEKCAKGRRVNNIFAKLEQTA